ncbi:MAG TPA: tyrosine--tRNA ligase [Opitutaceae bacterium]|nr:tyrosine--tRNA ligase [Opitutaceae bacterium]
MTIIEELKWRGLVADCTDLDALTKRSAAGPLTLYCGFDPTGDSLHVGSLIGQLTLRRFQLHGHSPIALAGGATGMIGDPSGKSAERNLLSREQLDSNLASIKTQLSRILDFDSKANPARMVDNAAWTAGVSYLDFLRDIGKHFSVNVMVAKEGIRSRMEGEGGISYTEFSYMVLQAHDFYHLRKAHGCELQIGGSDQWGNITAGTDLIRKKLGVPAWGLTFPLITKSDGTKFGKTETGTVWLDPRKTSPYRFYQFFINTEDAVVPDYLRKFTLLSADEIDALEARHASNPGAREAQRALAREVTSIVHGKSACDDAARTSEIMFGGGLDGITEALFNDVSEEIPTRQIEKSKIEGPGCPVVDLLVLSGLCASRGQARKDVEGGGIYLNNKRVAQAARSVALGDLLFGRYLLLRKGRRSYVLLRAV